MLAQRLPGVLPELSEQEALDTAAIYSVAAQPRTLNQWHQRPFRQPHHTSSAVALVGGGSIPRPGEISLAHGGILFLDEAPEFPRSVLESLRQPLETGKVFISRAARQAEFPANFQLIVALNPSPSGHHKDGRSGPDQIRRYLSRLSGPFLDRIELQVEVPLLPKGSLSQQKVEESSAQIKQRVAAARAIQLQRQGKTNARLSLTELEQHCRLSASDADYFETCLNQLKLSARSYHKLLKVARTLADLAKQPDIQRCHLLEALSYRAFDRLLNYLQSA